MGYGFESRVRLRVKGLRRRAGDGVDLLVVEPFEKHGKGAAAGAQGNRVGDESLVVRSPYVRLGIQDRLAELERLHEVGLHRFGELL